MSSKPTLTPQGREAQEARQRRQAEALRANLARRKAKGRSPAGAADGAETPAEPADSKGLGAKPGRA